MATTVPTPKFAVGDAVVIKRTGQAGTVTAIYPATVLYFFEVEVDGRRGTHKAAALKAAS